MLGRISFTGSRRGPGGPGGSRGALTHPSGELPHPRRSLPASSPERSGAARGKEASRAGEEEGKLVVPKDKGPVLQNFGN